MNQELNFYQQHLAKVSRSFAYCIQQMEAPLREWTSLAYLLCRALDTVEDTSWPTQEAQLKKIQEFAPLFESKSSSALAVQWSKGFSDQVTPAEKALIEDLPKLAADFKTCPAPVRQALSNLMTSMASGMSHFLAKSSGQQKISSLAELNEYCFFVAGVVGEAMTHLVTYKGAYGQGGRSVADTENHDAKYVNFTSRENILRSFHFGLFLQKVNILKDQFKDEKEGRFFIFDRRAVLKSLREHAEQTLTYIKMIPAQEHGYRVFCATSFFLGLATIPLLQIQDSTWLEPKIEKESAIELFQTIEAIADSNEKLNEMYRQYEEGFELIAESSAISASAARPEYVFEDWFFESYKGSLSKNEIQLI
ncbi:MAG: squalene/phytoene synthase family protein [Bdellovibrionota bacterium]